MAKLLIQMPDGEEVTHDLPEDKTTVGRLAENSLVIQDTSVSSRHAEISFKNNAFFVTDLGSTNGTFLNDEQITESALNHGDELRFGSISTRFESQNDSGELVVEPSESEAEETQTSRRPANFQCSSPQPIERDAVGCSSGQRLMVFDDRFWAFTGATVYEADGTLDQDRDYRAATRRCAA